MWIRSALVVAILLIVGDTEGAPDTGEGHDSSSGAHYRPNPNHDSGIEFPKNYRDGLKSGP